MDRKQVLQAVTPLAPGSPVPATTVAGRGFSNLTDLDDGLLDGEGTPTNPKGSPREDLSKRQIFERAFKDQRLTLYELSPYRVRVAWRAVRWIAVKLGVLDPSLLLGAMPDQAHDRVNGLDPMYRPLTPEQLTPPAPDRPTRRLMEVVRRCTDHGDAVSFDKLHDTEDRLENATKHGFSLLPCPETVEYWVEAFNIASEHLFLSRGSAKDRDQGRYGVLGLDKAETAAVACPVVPELLMWELFLVDEVTKMLACKGEHLIDQELRDFYGLLPDETRPVIMQARRQIRERTDLDTSERRAVMILQIDDVIARCQGNIDPRAELAALKLRAQIEGLNVAEPEDWHKMFKKVVNEVNKGKRQLSYDTSGDNEVIEASTKTKELPA